MYRDHLIGVVIPAYNEEGFVGDVISGIPEFVDRIYVVDDRSTDGTWAEILAVAGADRDDSGGRATDGGFDASANSDGAFIDITGSGSAADPHERALLDERATVHESVGRVVPIRHERNRGAGGAIKTGYLAVLADDPTVDITATIDADGQMDSGILSRFLDPIVEDQADYTKGNRLLGRNTREEMPAFRLFGNLLLTLLTKIASGYWKTMDPQNGYTAIATETLAAVDVEGLYEYYGYCTDLLIKLNVEQARVADVEMPARYGAETSSIKYEEYISKVSLLLLRGFLWRLQTRYLLLDFHPLALLYGLGALTAGTGIIEGLSALWTRLPTSATRRLGSPSTTSTLTHGVLTFGVGCAMLVLSMIFDMGENDGLESQVRE
jgi:glycosyltransferase involved in cell wall biosynthesis